MEETGRNRQERTKETGNRRDAVREQLFFLKRHLHTPRISAVGAAVERFVYILLFQKRHLDTPKTTPRYT
jgi:hypothetical protein